jgi:hypothetical protein
MKIPFTNLKSSLSTNLKNILNWVFWTVSFIIIIFITIINSILNIFEDPKTDMIYGEASKKIAETIILKDTINLNIDIQKNNSEVISYLKELLSNDHLEITTQENIRMQLRLFYVAILAAIISFLFSDKALAKKNIIKVILFIIIAMYSLEIHHHDLFKRSIAASFVRSHAITNIINNPTDNISYKLNFDNLHKRMECSAQNRIKRKIQTAFVLDAERFIFYIFPFSFLLIYDILNRKKASQGNDTLN